MNNQMNLPPLRDDSAGRLTMSGRVHRTLRRAIISMQLMPGDALSEAAIAQKLGTSRQPVREAFIKLAETGFVEIVPQKGTHVLRISSKEVENARFIRETVEVAIVRRAAETANANSIASIQSLVAAQQRAAKIDDHYQAFLELDDLFHQAIAEAAGFGSTWRIIEDLKGQLDRVRFLSLDEATPVDRLIIQHSAVADAIEAKDPGLAGRAMQEHLSEMLTSLPILASRHAELFLD